MIEREKQHSDQEKKHARKEQHEVQKKGKKEEKQAGMATDPEAMKDPGYVERIDEKTTKH